MQYYPILALDDEPDLLLAYETVLKKHYPLLGFTDPGKLLDYLETNDPCVILLDMRLPRHNGIDILKSIKKIKPEIEVLIVSAVKELRLAVEAMKSGAYDYLVKPFENQEIISLVEKALEKNHLYKENRNLKNLLMDANSGETMIGNSAPMRQVLDNINATAPSDSTVLITGETGTGKELVAKALHNKSRRRNHPMVTLNCAAIPDLLLESELFGHEKGSFTGAYERKIGKFEMADQGTLFLDEIGCLSPNLQAKLLRALQERKIERLGGSSPIAIDVRIISASNLDFKKALEEKQFRSDLYYRLNVIPIHLPPLRERQDDIPLLIDHFLKKLAAEHHSRPKQLESAAQNALANYDWPGNIRELQNILERLVVITKHDTITVSDLPIRPVSKAKSYSSLKSACKEFKKEFIEHALVANKDNRTRTAKALGINRSFLVQLIKEFKL